MREAASKICHGNAWLLSSAASASGSSTAGRLFCNGCWFSPRADTRAEAASALYSAEPVRFLPGAKI